MLLSDYQSNLQAIINQYTNEDIILSYDISVENRSAYLAFIQGKLNFLDGSVLFFKEYIDLQKYVDKLAYSFHYQDVNNNLIFRYDNAKHKPALGFIDHKHIKGKIISSKIPSLDQIIWEIITEYL